jgi:transposase InsO family protein
MTRVIHMPARHHVYIVQGLIRGTFTVLSPAHPLVLGVLYTHGSFPCSPPCASPTGYEPCAPTLAYRSPSLLSLFALHSSLSSSFSICIMSTSEDSRSGYAHVPVLTKDNFPRWQLGVRAFLTPNGHVHIIKRKKQTDGRMTDPVAPTDAAELESWEKSKQVAMGVLMATANGLHYKLVCRHEEDRAWVLWSAIEAYHVQQDACLRHEAWMLLFSIRKAPEESYIDLYHRVEDARDKIACVTPTTLTRQQQYDEIALFTTINALPADDCLHTQLVTQKDISLRDTYLAFLRTDRNAAATAAIESANAAFAGQCHKCEQPGHLAKDCPFAEQFRQVVARQANGNRGGGRGHGRGRGGANSANSANSHASQSGNSNGNSNGGSNGTSAASPAPASQETAGVSAFPSHASGASNDWLCDTGASCSMSRDCSAFFDLRPDRRPIRLADRKVIYSQGVGSIRFLSECGFLVTINNVLLVPLLASDLFSPNRFARDHRATYSEVTEYPKRKWINLRTGAVEFTATIRSDDLAYLDWKPVHTIESASVSIANLHACFNHMPYPVIRRLIRSESVTGILDLVADAVAEDFCEDCVNGKLTRAPHTKPTVRAERPLFRVFSDVHGPVPVRSRHGHFFWVTFINDHSRFPAVYFIAKKSDVFDAFRKYKAWAENVTGRYISILRDDKGGEYMTGAFGRFLADAGIRREHTIRDTPQQNGVTERMNRSISEGITTILSQSGLMRTWWEDAAIHWLYGKIRLPSSVTAPLSPFELFYGKKPDLSAMRPFGCLAYVHLQKDQRSALLPHATQCILIGYPSDYKGWKFWDPAACKEIISDSAVFRESIFPFHKPGLSGMDTAADSSRRVFSDREPAALGLRAPVRQLTSNFEHHPSLGDPLPEKQPSGAHVPGALAEANAAGPVGAFAIPLVDAVEFALSTSAVSEPRMLEDALKQPDVDKWVVAALAEIEAHVQNGTWELAQLPPGKRAIGSQWVFKIKRLPDGSIDKYKGRIVAQGYSQIQGVHYNEVFASTARMAAMRAVIAIAATEDLELESVDISTAFLNGEIDAEIYMKIPEGLEIDGEPRPGENPRRWVVRLLKGLYGIKQGPRIWALRLHSVLTSIGFERTDCDYSVYVYRRGDVRVMVPIHVDDLLLASNSKSAIQRVKAELASHFKLHDQGPARSILGIKIDRDRASRSVSLSQPGYIESILDQFRMTDCNPALTPMDENMKLSTWMSLDTPQGRLAMKAYPYRELIGKLLYLAIAMRPDIAYVVSVLCRFIENPGMDHWHMAKCVLRYLRGTVHMKLVYSRIDSPDLFTTYSDADLSGNPDNSWLMGGFAVCIGGGATQWGSRLQPHVSLLSTESEYTTASKVGCEIMWTHYLFEELGYDVSSPLLVDNKSAIQVAKHPEHQSTMKHVHRAYHWIRDQVEHKQISVSHVPGDDNPTDIFTKPLRRIKFTKFRAMLGLHPDRSVV